MTRMLSGDWKCHDCHAHNFAKRSTCFQCAAGKQDSDIIKSDRSSDDQSMQHTYPKGVSFRRGDWWCPSPSCKAANFASRRACFQCGQEKPKQPNEWECEACKFTNLGFRTHCHQCGLENPEPPKLQAGDWKCGECEYINFAKRTSCGQCNAAAA